MPAEGFMTEKVKTKKPWEMLFLEVVQVSVSTAFQKVGEDLKDTTDTADPGAGFRGLGCFLQACQFNCRVWGALGFETSGQEKYFPIYCCQRPNFSSSQPNTCVL